MHFILQLQYLLSVKAEQVLWLYELLRPKRENGHKEMTYGLLTACLDKKQGAQNMNYGYFQGY